MKVYAIVDGITYNLNKGDPAFFEADDGIGMPDLHRFDESGPLQHGTTDTGYLLDARYVTYIFGLVGATKPKLDDKRKQLVRMFRPSRIIIMKHVFDNGDEYYLDCVYSGGMRMPSSERRGGMYQRVGIILKAPDPTFYMLDTVSYSFQLGGAAGSNMPVPTEVPTEIGGSIIDIFHQVTYEGDFLVYPWIRLTGPLTSPIITNTSTGEVLDFTGITIDPGDYFDLDLRYGYKTIKDSTGVLQLDTITPISDISTWHIAADDEVTDGINSVRVQASGATGSSNVELSFQVKNIGH